MAASGQVASSGGTVAAQFRGGRGQVVGVDALASYWVANNAATLEARVSLLGSDATVRA